MRILLLSHTPNDINAGASRVYHLLDQALSARGHSVRTWHKEEFRPLRYTVAQKAVDRFLLPNFLAWRARAEAASGYDVVMASSGTGHSLFRMMRSHKNRPLLVNHTHELWIFGFQARIDEHLMGRARLPLLFRTLAAVTGPIKGVWDTGAIRHADLTVVQNDRDYDFLMRSGLDVDRLVKIAPGIHPQVLAVSTAAPRPSARPAASLLWCGSWETRKGIDTLPAAFDLILAQLPEATLTIAGTRRPEGEIRRCFSTTAGRCLRILPTLPMSAQIAEFERHAIFLFPSLSEGFGLAVVEAMALGLAAVTTFTGVGGDALRDRDTAMIVPQASAVHLARAVVELIRDDALRHRIAVRGQELARTFTVEQMAASYERAFEEALSRASAVRTLGD